MPKFKTFAYVTVWIIICILLFIFDIANASGIKTFEKKKRVEVEGIISTELEKYSDELGGAMEYLAVSKGGKEYESILVLDAVPEDIYKTLVKLGVNKGKPAQFDADTGKVIPPSGDKVRLFVEWRDGNSVKKVRAENLIYNIKTEESMENTEWLFTGSVMGFFDPESDSEVLKAQVTKSIASFHDGDDSVILQHPKPVSADSVPYRVNSKVMPKAGTKINLVIDANNPLIQVYAFISGKVQGVGFRNFTLSSVRQIGDIKGYVKNLSDGRVELVAEGHKFDLDSLIERVKQGPRSARVEDVEIKERPFSGKYKSFEILY